MKKGLNSLKLTVNKTSIIVFLYCTTLFEIWGTFRIPIELICIVYFFIQHITNRSPFHINKTNRYYVWGFIFTCMCFLSVLYTKEIYEAYLGARMFLETFIAGIAISLYANSTERLIKILKFIIASAVVFVFKIVLTNPMQTILTQRQLGSINANSVGMSMAICTIITIWLLKEKKIEIWKVVSVLLIFLPAIIVSGSKKAIFILLFGTTFLILLYQKKIIRIVSYLILAVLALYCIYYLLMHNSILYSFIGYRVEGLVDALFYGYSSGDLSTRGRIDMIQIAIQEWKEKPILGYGINTFGVINGISAFDSVNMYSHCNYAELLFGVGLIGTVIYYSIFLWLLINQVKSFRRFAIQKLYFTIIVIILIIDIGMVSYIDEFIQAQIVFASVSCADVLRRRTDKISVTYGSVFE